MDLCATCKQRVEDGSVICPNCGAKLDLPGAFLQVLGWVLIALSTIPFAIGEVTTGVRNPIPLLIGVALLGAGIVCVVAGKIQSKTAPPTVMPQSDSVTTPPSSTS